jgi:uncharacterized protein YndB with AHSA1/START domain
MSDYSTSIEIDAEPRVVFEHLVTVDGMLAWMGQRATLDPTPGGAFEIDIDGAPVRGTYLEIDPPRRVVVSWGEEGNSSFPAGSSQVEFTLTPVGAGTRVELRHTGLPESKAAGYAQGWEHFLRRLAVAAS